MELQRFKSLSWAEDRWYRSLLSPCRLLWPGKCWQHCCKMGYKSLWLGSLKNYSSHYFSLFCSTSAEDFIPQRRGRKSSLLPAEPGRWRSTLAFLWFLVSFCFQLHWVTHILGFLHDICAILRSCLIRPYPNHVTFSATTFFLYIRLPHPNNFLSFFPFSVFILLGLFPPWLSPVCLSTWDWHYQLISHNAHRTA